MKSGRVVAEVGGQKSEVSNLPSLSDSKVQTERLAKVLWGKKRGPGVSPGASAKAFIPRNS